MQGGKEAGRREEKRWTISRLLGMNPARQPGVRDFRDSRAIGGMRSCAEIAGAQAGVPVAPKSFVEGVARRSRRALLASFPGVVACTY